MCFPSGRVVLYAVIMVFSLPKTLVNNPGQKSGQKPDQKSSSGKLRVLEVLWHFLVGLEMFFLEAGSTVHCIYDLFTPLDAGQTLAKNLVKTLAKNLIKNLSKNLVKMRVRKTEQRLRNK